MNAYTYLLGDRGVIDHDAIFQCVLGSRASLVPRHSCLLYIHDPPVPCVLVEKPFRYRVWHGLKASYLVSHMATEHVTNAYLMLERQGDRLGRAAERRVLWIRALEAELTRRQSAER